MRVIRAAVLAAIAKKALDEVRKPENQRKIKQLIASAKDRRGPRSTAAGPVDGPDQVGA